MQQFQAGYILNGIFDLFIEEMLSTAFGQTKKRGDLFQSIQYFFNDDKLKDEIAHALHIIDPRVKKEYQFAAAIDSNNNQFKDDFLQSLLPEYLGEAFIQLVDTDRKYSSLAEFEKHQQNTSIKKEYADIWDHKADFVLEMPYENKNKKGIAIEIDDTPVETSYDHKLDTLKNNYAAEINWASPYTLETGKFANSSEELKPLIDFTYNPYFDTISKNYRSPLYKSKDGLDALQLALSPIAVARIQKTVIEYILSGNLNLDATSWSIGIIERDVPCAYLAFQDLKLMFNNLFALKGENKKFPEIKLNIYRTNEFKNAKLNSLYSGNIKSVENFDENLVFDLLIDVSVLQRSNIRNPDYKTNAKFKANIRSARSISSKRKFLTDKHIRYFDVKYGNKDRNRTDKAREALKYFLKNIFRKEQFLPGQLEILNKSLQQKNVLGLLPTGGGKSIAYQLAALLQPGFSVVVNPLMSVMTDQIHALQKLGIDGLTYLNASVKKADEMSYKLSEINSCDSLFIYIEPEFFRDKKTQVLLENLPINKVYPSYFIVDEAHCISEWGHDFRPEYHRLGEIARKILKPKRPGYVPIIGLTATADYNVQFDIQDELFVENENIVRPDFSQAKLKFKIVDVSSTSIKPEMAISQAKYLSGSRKQVHFTYLMEELFPNGVSKNQENNTLIFCPAPYGQTGISDEKGDGLADKIEANFEQLRLGKFWGSTNDGTDSVPLSLAEQSEKYHQEFLDSEIDILIATKSFGIGINKPDIRNIIYFNMPNSVESFIQQTYRAGRDGKETNCTVIVDNQLIQIPAGSLLKNYHKSDKIPFDKYIALEPLLKSYKGKVKEIAVLNELLKEKIKLMDILTWLKKMSVPRNRLLKKK